MIYSNIELVTPESAKLYLSSNTSNRPVRKHHVASLAADMASGRWHMNGAGIVFSAKNVLLDGQHRLMAIIQSGTPCMMLVVRGVNDAAMPTIDANVARTASDVLGLNGFKNTNRVAAAARVLMALRDGIYTSTVKRSNIQIVEFLHKHPKLHDAAVETISASRLIGSAAVCSWFYMAVYVSSYERQARTALDVLCRGVPSYDGDPMHVFRERMMRVPCRTVQDRLTLFWTLVASWNDFLNGDTAKICKLRRSPVAMVGVDYSEM